MLLAPRRHSPFRIEQKQSTFTLVINFQYQLAIVNHQLSIISYQLSKHQLSTINHQYRIMSNDLSIRGATSFHIVGTSLGGTRSAFILYSGE